MSKRTLLVEEYNETRLHEQGRVQIVKKRRHNVYKVKPRLISNWEMNESSRCFSLLELNQFINDNRYTFSYELYAPMSSSPIMINLNGDLLASRANSSNPLILVFFGPMNETHLELLNTYYTELSQRFNADMIGITANVSGNSYKFPIIDDCQGHISSFFKNLDPLGGGIYPLDKIVLIDGHNFVKAEINVKNRTSPASRVDTWLTNEECVMNLIECLVYLEVVSQND